MIFPPLPDVRAVLVLVRAALVRAGLWPRPLWWLGKALRITIAPTAGGYVLKIHRTQGVEWVDLPARPDTSDRPGNRPDEREFTAVAHALAERGLTWQTPWLIDDHGHLTALVSAQLTPPADPGTTPRSEDRR